MKGKRSLQLRRETITTLSRRGLGGIHGGSTYLCYSLIESSEHCLHVSIELWHKLTRLSDNGSCGCPMTPPPYTTAYVQPSDMPGGHASC